MQLPVHTIHLVYSLLKNIFHNFPRNFLKLYAISLKARINHKQRKICYDWGIPFLITIERSEAFFQSAAVWLYERNAKNYTLQCKLQNQQTLAMKVKKIQDVTVRAKENTKRLVPMTSKIAMLYSY